jgi:putative transposase
MQNKPQYDPKKHHRRSIRLKNYDYTQPEYYFITICTYHRENTLGIIQNGEMECSKFGKIAEVYWQRLPTIFSYMKLDEYVIMPNHIHGIIQIIETSQNPNITNPNSKSGSIPHSINAIVQNFQSITTRKINKLENIRGTPFWQRNFYEHVIRNEISLMEIQKYIRNNPLQWEMDRLYNK